MVWLLAVLAGLGAFACAQDDASGQYLSQSNSQPTTTQTTETIHEKTGPNSSRTIRRTKRVSESSSPELDQADAAIGKQDYGTAEPLLQKLVEREPTNYVGWFDLGFVENALGKVDASIAAYRKSVAAKSDVFESNLNLGLQLAKTNQPDAEQFLRAATQLKPTAQATEGQYRAWLSLAHVLERKNPEEALGAYHHAATLQPKDAEPHLGAGLALEQQNKFSDAEQEYKQAFALDPTSDALTGLANIYMRGRRFPEAEQYLRQVVAASPDRAAPHVQLGRVLEAQGKHNDAIAELEAGEKLAPADEAVQRDLAEIFVSAGKNDQAEAKYRVLVTAHANDASLHHELGQSLLRQKKFTEAQAEFLTSIKIKPDFGEAYGDLAFAAAENKDYALTVKALDMRVKFLPEAPMTYFLRASALDHLHDYKQASVNYHLFLNTAGDKYPDQQWQAKHRLITLEPKK
jgi:tetratricopeptide (TPR) repeat protein